MGRDLTLFPENATKSNLKQFIESLNFHKCKHLWDWPQDTLNYSWFEIKDFKSFDGVSVDIYPLKNDEIIFPNCHWAMHVRNTYSASYYDVEMLNNVLRSARKLFGGKIIGEYGINRYAPLWDDKSTPISRGVALIYENIEQNMSKLQVSLPDNYIKYGEAEDDSKNETIEFIKMLDPSRVLYNGLVPFAVSMFENFFQETFKVLIKYDQNALEYREKYKQKLDFQELLEIKNNDKTIEDFIASKYTFQNLDKLNKAYKDWLKIDVRNLLYKKKKVGSKIKIIENRISEIINYRHGVIHHFYIDNTLEKKDLLEIFSTVKLAIETIVDFLEDKYSINIKDLI